MAPGRSKRPNVIRLLGDLRTPTPKEGHVRLCSAWTPAPEVCCGGLTSKELDGGAQVAPLPDQVTGPVASFTANGAYDQERVAAAVVPRVRQRQGKSIQSVASRRNVTTAFLVVFRLRLIAGGTRANRKQRGRRLSAEASLGAVDVPGGVPYSEGRNTGTGRSPA